MGDQVNSFIVQFQSPNGKFLRIPPLLSNRWGDLWGNGIRLKTRYGKIWKVDIEKRNNDFWMGPKWDEFQARYQINYRDKVYFRHKENNLFEVVIMGIDGVEKVFLSGEHMLNHIWFYKMMKTVGLGAKMVLPDAFSTEFGSFLDNPITLIGDDGAETDVSWSSNSRIDSISFEAGWEVFLQKYNISRDDILIFKFDFSNVLKVNVIKEMSGMMEENHTSKSVVLSGSGKEGEELWRAKLTKASGKKGRPLYVPAKVVKTLLKSHPETITVKLEPGDYEKWDLIWSQARNECKIGRGWYEFQEMLKLKPGDLVKFRSLGNKECIEVEVVQT